MGEMARRVKSEALGRAKRQQNIDKLKDELKVKSPLVQGVELRVWKWLRWEP